MMKRSPCSPETRLKISLAQKGKPRRPLTDAEKVSVREGMRRYFSVTLVPKPYHNREWLYQKYVIERLSPYKIAKLCDDYGARIWYWIDKFGLATRGRSEAVKEHYQQNPDAVMSGAKNPLYGIKRTPEDKERLRKISLANWKDPAYVKKVLDGFCFRPSRPEKVFQKFAIENVYYTGDGTWWKKLANGKYKNPDFKVKGQDKVIEIYGKYWHRNDDPQDLIGAYRGVGLDCLVIQEKEIYDNPEDVRSRAIQFTQS